MKAHLFWLAVVGCGVVAACGGSSVSPTGATDGGGIDPNERDAASDASRGDGGTTVTGKPCSPATAEGDACSAEGTFCNPTPCTDECQFCNALRCEQGKWGRMEAFPMPQAYCASAPCGELTCGTGESCVRTSGGPSGGSTSDACKKLPSGCFECECASKAACVGMQTTCTADPATQKPSVDCHAQ